MNNILNHNDGDDNFTFRYLCRTKELPPGKSRQFSINSEKGTKIEIDVFNIDEIYYAISNTCRHQGAVRASPIMEREL